MITQHIFGTLENKAQVNAFTLENGAAKAVVLEYGCALQSFSIMLSNNETRDIVLGYDDIGGYVNGTSSQGAFVGRHANRIKGAAFELNGKEYELADNNDGNHLHGVFGKKLFKGTIEGESVVLRAQSPSGEDGFPGNMSLRVTYTLLENGALSMNYTAQTDEDTIVNLTNHSYFNLDKDVKNNVYNQTLWLNCKGFCEADETSCTTGRILPVQGTPMDFTCAKPIGQDIDADFEQLKQAKGYDHNFVIDKAEHELALCAMAKSSDGAITMEVYTTQPGLQFYSANYLNETGKGGAEYFPRCAFCIETQHYPCSNLYPHFPSVVLKKNEIFDETTIYKLYENV